MVKKRKKEAETLFSEPPKDVAEEKVTEPSEAEVEAEKEKQRLARLEQASTGTIEDIRTLRLMYWDKSVLETVLQAQVQRNAYEQRIQALKNEMSAVIRGWEQKQKLITRKIFELRKELEEDYGIIMSQWGFDDETALLVRLPQQEAAQIDEEEDQGKLKESTESEVSDGGTKT